MFFQASQIFEPFLDLSLPVHEEKGRHTIPRKGSKSAADSYLPNEEKKGPSKHQQKKLAKSAKKAVSFPIADATSAFAIWFQYSRIPK